VGAGRRIAEYRDEARLDLVRDHVLPPPGLDVRSRPGEPDDVDEEALGQPVPAHDARRELGSLLGQCHATARAREVAVVREPPDHLGDGLGAVPEPLDKASLDDVHALLDESVDRLEVFLERRVESVRHRPPAYRSLRP